MTGAPSRFPRPLAWFTAARWGRTIAEKLYAPLDRALYRVTRGRIGLSPRKTVLLLTTTGRRSGEPRRVPILYLEEGDRLWVVASNWGKPHHPAWSSNLLAHPEATVQIGSTTRTVRARLATEEERRRLWPRLLELYPTWKQYATWTDRSFRLFCLE